MLFVGLLIALYVIGVPVAFAMITVSVIVMLSPWGGGEISYPAISGNLLHGLNTFSLLAIPLYLMLGRLMNSIGMTEDIFAFANALVGQFRGGIAYVNIMASTFFAGMSGAAVADAAGLGRIEYKAMRDYGYGERISIGLIGSSALIGPIIPPSIPLILYGVIAEESIGALFVAGIIPGLLLAVSLMITVYILAWRNNYSPTSEFSLGELGRTFVRAFPVLIIPGIIIGGILGGYFTATEAGAVALIYLFLLATIQKRLTLSTLISEIRDSAIETFAITFIIAAAFVYGAVAVEVRLPFILGDAISELTENPVLILFIITISLLIIGMFMEPAAAITVVVPIFAPMIELVDIDPIHFGIVLVLALMVGLITPPLGVVLFVLDKVTDVALEEIFRAMPFFYIPVVIVLILLILVPDLTLALPELAGL